jgi:protocatechuate 3,4-dioxygenase beta subunit
MSEASRRALSTPSRRILLMTGGAVVALGAAGFVWLRQSTGATSAKPISFSFDDSDRCVVTASMTEGPYYVDEALVRRDIREQRPGKEFLLRLKVVDAATCAALPGAAVDIWHCDASGNYSLGAARFLRGRQIAGADGVVEFVTIYPGWYQGRTPHIHMKVFVNEREAATSQMFFAKELSADVYASPPYAAKGLADTTNDNDGVLRWARSSDGAWPKVARDGARLVGTLTIGVARA